MINPINNRKVRFFPEHGLENSSELLLGPKSERGNLTWQTNPIMVQA